ncbi:MAG TPA: hypothetical protein IAB71_10050 [Candidatus Scatomonas pullistercoris]|uniref:ATPase n=1 Tax=Candidatus Scatomonas pullistercoris TaxID=2840920 RepID=A0A9D1P3Z9_9FIRM|nr:hypothetical protein [Candidatus Scatomonas pullistercoris]
MDEILSKLSEIETAASRIREGAELQKKALDQQQEDRISKFDRQVEAEAEQEVEKLRKELSRSVQKDLEEMKKNAEVSLADMEQYYQQNCQKMVSQIYEKIVRK